MNRTRTPRSPFFLRTGLLLGLATTGKPGAQASPWVGLSHWNARPFVEATLGVNFHFPFPGDRFGFALAAGDFNGDGADDLATGIPGNDCGANLALSDCGEDAPTMDIVPRRLAEVAPTGTEGAMFDWSASPAVAEELAAPVGIVRPSFSEGDCMLFDHLLLHRTAARPDMPRERYAMETWLFGPSAYPEGQIPLVY